MAGLDFYVYERLYVGTEFGLKYYFTIDGKDKSEIDGKETVIKDPDVTNAIGQFYTPAVRIGWVF